MSQFSFEAKALGLFMDQEDSKQAAEGLAYEIAASLKAEIEEDGPDALKNLPALKQAILDHAVEQAEEAGYERN